MRPHHNQPEPPARKEEFFRQLERVASSQMLQSSVNLQRLLMYLGARSLSNEVHDLKEYIIGLECFGRPDAYDPRTDATVRVHAWKLRTKLDQYYRSEGAADPVIIELPKGGFALRFTMRGDGPNSPAAKLRVPLAWVVSPAAAAAAVLLALWVAPQAAPSGLSSFGVRSVWGPILRSTDPVVVLLGSPMFVKKGGMVLRMPAVNDATDLREAGISRVAGFDVVNTPAKPAYSYVGFGETSAAFRVAGILAGRKGDLVLKRSIAAGVNEYNRGHLILLGNPKTNAAMRPYAGGLGFRVHDCDVWNKHPAHGEPAKYSCVANAAGEVEEAFAVFTRLPRDANGHSTYLLSGGSAQAMALVTEAVTDPRILVRIIRSLDGSGVSLPEGFQVVLRGRFEGNKPAAIQVVAQRGWGPRSHLR